jgi:predicted secreted hydrolase
VSGQLPGRPAQPVTGQAWLDHEWSSELLPEGAQGWDWIGLNLDDGSGLMAFRLRDAAGKALWSAATLRPAGQSGQALPPEAVHFTPLRQWHSPFGHRLAGGLAGAGGRASARTAAADR